MNATDKLKQLMQGKPVEGAEVLDEGIQPANIPEPQVAESVAATLAQRGSRYGDFTDHAELCQDLKHVMSSFKKRSKVTADNGKTTGTITIPWEELCAVQKQALEVIVDKIARILSGDPNYDDNWHDIQGYAKLVEDRLPCNQTKETLNV